MMDVSGEAPTTATDCGESSAPRSGTELAQAEAASDDAAQHFCGSALDRQLGRDAGGAGDDCVECLARGRIRVDERCEVARPRGQRLLPERADVFDERAFYHRLLARLEHAVHRDRHPAQRVELRDEAAQTFGPPQVGSVAEYAHQLEQHARSLEEALRAAALVGEL